MAKLIVEVDVPGETAEEVRARFDAHPDDYYPTGDRDVIAVDEAELVPLADEPSFYAFRLRAIGDGASAVPRYVWRENRPCT